MTIAADAMAYVVSRIAPELAVADFRKRRHSFNRVKGDDLVHVVSFQMAPKLPPGATEVPPLALERGDDGVGQTVPRETSGCRQ